MKILIDTINDFEDFIWNHRNEIISSLCGESDGWNQKIDALNKILLNSNISISDDIWDNAEFEKIINEI